VIAEVHVRAYVTRSDSTCRSWILDHRVTRDPWYCDRLPPSPCTYASSLVSRSPSLAVDVSDLGALGGEKERADKRDCPRDQIGEIKLKFKVSAGFRSRHFYSAAIAVMAFRALGVNKHQRD